MAESNVEIEGINYYTLYEQPNPETNSAPCVLLVHALMSNLHMYDSTVKVLHSAGYSTLRYDQVGHHNTPPPTTQTTQTRRMSQPQPLTYHLDDLTRHMHSLVKARTGDSQLAGVIGCSIGGVMALRYGMLFPSDVAKIISLAAPGISTPEPAKQLWAERIAIFESDVQNSTHRLAHATVARWLPGSEPEDEHARSTALPHVLSCSLPGYRILADAITNYDYADQLGKIRVPTLVVAGSEDAAGPPEVLEKVAKGIEGARFVTLHGVGHLPPLHRPELFEEVMLSFLGKAK